MFIIIMLRWQDAIFLISKWKDDFPWPNGNCQNLVIVLNKPLNKVYYYLFVPIFHFQMYAYQNKVMAQIFIFQTSFNLNTYFAQKNIVKCSVKSNEPPSTVVQTTWLQTMQTKNYIMFFKMHCKILRSKFEKSRAYKIQKKNLHISPKHNEVGTYM